MASFWSSFPPIAEGLNRVRARLLRQAESLPVPLRGELTPLLQREGKFLRAGLLLLSSEAKTQAQADAVESAAAAVEILHLATLIHDDIVDQAALRRSEPAFYRQVGTQKAVLYGDLLLATAFRMVSQDVGPSSARALSELVAVMAGSEIQQLNDRYQLPVSARQILRKSMGKTALLFSLSLFVGAIESGRPVAVSLGLRRAGYSLGMAFQLQDDLLDWMGDPALMGKPNFGDLLSGVYTWPVVQAWRQDPERTQRKLLAVRAGQLAPSELKDQWMAEGLRSGTAVVVDKYLDRTRRDLDKALGAGSPERETWNQVLEKLLDRQG